MGPAARPFSPRHRPHAGQAAGPAVGRRFAGLVAAGLLAAVAVTATGCSQGLPATEWASRVCGALNPWRLHIADLNAQAQQQMQAATNPTQTRDNLLTLLSGAQRATDDARTALAGAGVPNVEGGEQIAARFSDSITKARDAYARARDSLQRLPVDDPTVFYDGVIAVLGTLQSEYAASAVDTTRIDSMELRDAFDRSEQCQ